MEKILTFTAKAENSAVWISHANGNRPNVEFSRNNGHTWKELAGPAALPSIGDSVMIRGFSKAGFSYGLGTYSHMFANCTNLTYVGDIPATYAFDNSSPA